MGTPGDYLNRFLTRKEQYAIGAIVVALCIGSLALVWQARSAGGNGDSVVDAPSYAAGQSHENAPSAQNGAQSAAAKTEPSEEAVVVEEPSPPDEKPAESTDPEPITVVVQGAVRRPGLYELDETSRVYDLLRRAGGAEEDARLDELNLAARLIDGSTLVVPRDAHSEVVDDRLIIRGRQSAVRLNPRAYIRGATPREAAPSGTAETSASTARSSDTSAPESGLIDLNHASQSELETLPGIGPVLANNIIQFRRDRPFDRIEDAERVSGIGPKRLEAIRDLVTVTSR